MGFEQRHILGHSCILLKQRQSLDSIEDLPETSHLQEQTMSPGLGQTAILQLLRVSTRSQWHNAHHAA